MSSFQLSQSVRTVWQRVCNLDDRIHREYADVYVTVMLSTITKKQRDSLRLLLYWMTLRKLFLTAVGFLSFFAITTSTLKFIFWISSFFRSIDIAFHLSLAVLGSLGIAVGMYIFSFSWRCIKLVDVTTLQKFLIQQKQTPLLSNVGGTHSSASVSVFSQK